MSETSGVYVVSQSASDEDFTEVDRVQVAPNVNLNLASIVQGGQANPATGGPEQAAVERDGKGPEAKKFKASISETCLGVTTGDYRLEERLNGILCCAVCLDLPNLTIFQCTNGHLMCASCLYHLLADARLKDEPATCPSCRCEINRSLCVRNLAVEKAISEMPCACQFCAGQLPRHRLTNHESQVCPERPVSCKYARIGCTWHGPYRDLEAHKVTCEFPNKTGKDLMDSISRIQNEKCADLKQYQSMLDFLSYEKVMITDLQLKTYRTDDFIPKLFFEATRFTAFSIQWVVKARVNDSTDSRAVHTATRSLSYQLVAKTKPTTPMRMMYVALKGPFSEDRVSPVTYETEFTGDLLESAFHDLPIIDSYQVNKMVSAKLINLRLVLIHLQK